MGGSDVRTAGLGTGRKNVYRVQNPLRSGGFRDQNRICTQKAAISHGKVRLARPAYVPPVALVVLVLVPPAGAGEPAFNW